MSKEETKNEHKETRSQNKENRSIESPVAVLGRMDDPAAQRQDILTHSFWEEGNLAVVGSGQTGKTTFLQTLLVSMCMSYQPDEVQFYLVDIKGFDISLIEDIPRLMTMAYSYAKLYIETEKLHIVSNHKLPYICYMESADSLCVEIPVWSKKTKTEEMLTLDNMSKRYLHTFLFLRI